MSFEVDVSVRRGDRIIAARFVTGSGITALFGPSGAGKTSVLDMVAGLVRPDSGRVVVGGEVLFDAAAGIDVPPERRRCGYVFQDLRLFPHRRVRDNLLFGWRLAPPEARWLSLEGACGFLGIGHLLDRAPASLSGGEAQRVAIGRALLSGPRFLAMDEPLSSLDLPRREEILKVVERIRDELNLPILYVTHDPDELARLAATVVRLG
jgi:molybdate transport system ATP-binding protein